LKNHLFLFLLSIVLFACKERITSPILKKDIDFDKGESLIYKNNDSAFFYFNQVATSIKDSLRTAMSFNYMAVIQSDAGDYFGAQESLMRSLKFLEERKKADRICIASNYNELGLTSMYLKHYGLALSYYNKAIKFSENAEFKLVMRNNKALAYQKLGQYHQALYIYNEIIAQKTKNSVEYARILSNIAKTKWLQNSNYNAAPQLLKALNIRKNENDEWGQNASYAHLSDYYSKKQPDSALLYALKMYHIAQKLKSPDDQLEALQKLIKLSPPNATKQYFESYQQLADSVQTARNAAKNQFALIRYETEKSKADNLKLQKENTEKKYEVATREFLLAAGFILFIAVSIIAVLWYRKRKQKIESEAQTVIRESQLKTSKKVHDVVANGLYRVMSEMENQEQINKDLVLDRIEDLYKKSRDISYEEPIRANQPFHEKVAGLLKSFATENTHIAIAGNAAELWEKINPKVQYEIENILQELMVNMKKHSAASKVAVRFEQKENQINIFYTDNGLGMKAGTTFNNGLRNTGNRIAGISGAINFDTTAEKGLKIQLSFPIS